MTGGGIPGRRRIVLAFQPHRYTRTRDCFEDFVKVLSTVDAQKSCRGPRLVIDRRDAWREGAQALWLDEAGVRRATANAVRGDRPWVPGSASRQAQTVKAPGI